MVFKKPLTVLVNPVKQYEVKGSKLSIFEMAFTEMACVSPEGVMEQEQEFLTILANAQSFQADDTTLTIVCEVDPILRTG